MGWGKGAKFYLFMNPGHQIQGILRNVVPEFRYNLFEWFWGRQFCAKPSHTN